MQKRSLGNSDIQIAPMVFGGNVFGWTVDQKQSYSLLDGCVDLGINMIDSANVYSAWVDGNEGGESEAVIGNWLSQSGKRDQVLLATKVGIPMGDDPGGLSKQSIIKAAEDSLKRLKTDYIDVYYAHRDDPDVTFDETFSAFEQLIKDGKVRAIASSNYSAERLKAAITFAQENHLPQFVAHQPEYNLFDRSGYEKALEPVCRDLSVGVVTYFSLASGFLSGKYRTKKDLEQSSRGAGFLEKYLTDRGLKILKALDEVASQHNSNPAAVALAWIAHRSSITAPIASATTLPQLEQLANGAMLTLTEADMAYLDEASAY